MSRLGIKLAAMLVTGLGLAPSAFADWSFTRANQVYMGTSFNQAGTATTGESMNVNVRSWSAAGPPATFDAAPMTIYGSSGIGIMENEPGSDEHGVDNLSNTDAVVLKFDSSVILNQVRLGYVQSGYDSDITVLRWNPAIAGATPDMDNMTWSSLISSGWELVGSYADLGTTARTLGNTTKDSSWWLISAYNSTYGGTATADGRGTLGGGNDYFKLASVAGSLGGGGQNEAPEPASLALVAVALAGTLGLRRRRRD